MDKAVDESESEQVARIAEIEGSTAEAISKLEETRADRLAKADADVDAQISSLREKAASLQADIERIGEKNANKKIALDDAFVIASRGEPLPKEALKRLQKEVDKRAQALEAGRAGSRKAAEAGLEGELARLRENAMAEMEPLRKKINEARESIREQFDLQIEELEDLKDPIPDDQCTFLPEQNFRDLTEKYPGVVRAGMGAEAILEILDRVDLDRLALKLRAEIQNFSGQRRKKATKRLRVVEALRKSGNKPAWMVVGILPVLPPDLRPMVKLDGGRFATSDLNDFYRRVINRNNRVKRLLEGGAPEIIIRNEERMLQEAVDSLIDNGRRGRAVSGSSNHKLKSLSDMLKGKQGRFRQNLLGKRVDYSGRSVIVVGPELKLHQCGLPKRMALELFKPFVMRKLVEQNFAHNIKSAKRFVERVKPEVWDVLEEVIKDHPVLLNRAPTLHRLGIQAFEAVLVEGSAIQLHPLVCSAFNADFDGDQMAVHVPLSDKAQDEARQFMMSTRNLLAPGTGEPSIGASQDMVLGCFYLTQDRRDKKGEGCVFTDATEALLALQHGLVDLQALIQVRLGEVDVYDNPPPEKATMHANGTRVKTTVGRIIFNEALPERLRFKNYAMKKENLRQIIAECFKAYGRVRTAELADEIKRLGFSYATKFGVTIAISDVKVPIGKQEELARADAKIAELEEQYREGLITDHEKYQQTVDVWNEATENVTKMVESTLDPYGSIYTIAKSGATKAKFQQIRQLSGMRGLMAGPSVSV